MTGGTNAGGPGRPPNAAKAHMAAVIYGKKHQDAVKKVLENPKHTQFTGMTKLAYLYVIGVPQPEDPSVGGPGSGGVIIDL